MDVRLGFCRFLKEASALGRYMIRMGEVEISQKYRPVLRRMLMGFVLFLPFVALTNGDNTGKRHEQVKKKSEAVKNIADSKSGVQSKTDGGSRRGPASRKSVQP